MDTNEKIFGIFPSKGCTRSWFPIFCYWEECFSKCPAFFLWIFIIFFVEFQGVLLLDQRAIWLDFWTFKKLWTWWAFLPLALPEGLSLPQVSSVLTHKYLPVANGELSKTLWLLLDRSHLSIPCEVIRMELKCNHHLGPLWILCSACHEVSQQKQHFNSLPVGSLWLNTSHVSSQIFFSIGGKRDILILNVLELTRTWSDSAGTLDSVVCVSLS